MNKYLPIIVILVLVGCGKKAEEGKPPYIGKDIKEDYKPDNFSLTNTKENKPIIESGKSSEKYIESPVIPPPIEESKNSSVEMKEQLNYKNIAIENGLKWLAKEQNTDGSWGTEDNDKLYNTPLALNCFNSRGISIDSNSPYGKIVRNAVKWIISQQDQNGEWKGHSFLPLESLTEAYVLLSNAFDEKKELHNSVKLSVKKGLLLLMQKQKESSSFSVSLDPMKAAIEDLRCLIILSFNKGFNQPLNDKISKSRLKLKAFLQKKYNDKNNIVDIIVFVKDAPRTIRTNKDVVKTITKSIDNMSNSIPIELRPFAVSALMTYGDPLYRITGKIIRSQIKKGENAGAFVETPNQPVSIPYSALSLRCLMWYFRYDKIMFTSEGNWRRTIGVNTKKLYLCD